MSVLTILQLPDKRLRQVAKPVLVFDDALQKLIADMFETMYQAPGVGLAATQVNIHQRVFVADVAGEEEPKNPLHFVNPVITSVNGTQIYKEGCLSVPGFHEEVKRAESLIVEAVDFQGKPFSLETTGLLAVCIQHEIDHLNGKLFVDRLSALKRERINKKIQKSKR